MRTACHLTFDSLSWRTAFGWGFAGADEETRDHWIEQLTSVCRTA